MLANKFAVVKKSTTNNEDHNLDALYCTCLHNEHLHSELQTPVPGVNQ